LRSGGFQRFEIHALSGDLRGRLKLREKLPIC
jgi:hypothetical protein